MSVVVKRNDKYLLICKGAPESILQVSSKMKLNGRIVQLDPTIAEESAEKLFRKGFRVISVAVKDVEKKPDYSKDEENNLTSTWISMLQGSFEIHSQRIHRSVQKTRR